MKDLEQYGSGATIYTAVDDIDLRGHLGVHIEIPVLRGTRTVFLNAQELELFAACAPNSVAELLTTLTRSAHTDPDVARPIRSERQCG